MPVVNELIRSEADGTISFGNYKLNTKSKISDFEYCGDSYKVKTYKEITKLEKNGMFLYESVPGTTVDHLRLLEDGISFKVSGNDDAQITLELEGNVNYKLFVNGDHTGEILTNLSGKLIFSIDLSDKHEAEIKVFKA